MEVSILKFKVTVVVAESLESFLVNSPFFPLSILFICPPPLLSSSSIPLKLIISEGWSWGRSKGGRHEEREDDSENRGGEKEKKDTKSGGKIHITWL